MMQDGLGETFWDVHGVEIGACPIFNIFYRPVKTKPTGIFFYALDAVGRSVREELGERERHTRGIHSNGFLERFTDGLGVEFKVK